MQVSKVSQGLIFTLAHVQGIKGSNRIGVGTCTHSCSGLKIHVHVLYKQYYNLL